MSGTEFKRQISSNNADAQWVWGVVERYETALILYATRLTCDTERARDVVQEVFLRLCSQDRKEIESHLAEWLYTVCRNRALDVHRKEKRMSTLSENQAAKQPDGRLEPPAAMEQAETQSTMIRAMTALPENQQEVLRLKFQNGLSYKEISRITNLTVGNVGFLLHTGLKALRQQVVSKG